MKALSTEKKTLAASEIAFQTVNYTLLILFMLACVYPFYYIFIYSISDSRLAMTGVTLFPKGLTLVAYSKVFVIEGILNGAWISVLRTVLGCSIRGSRTMPCRFCERH